jgi:2-methylcitrate dehydratase PrpD
VPVRVDRRKLIGGAVGLLAPLAAAAQAVGSAAARQSPEDARRPADRNSGESRAVAEHVAGARIEAMSPAARHMSARSILDAIGVSMAASGEEPVCRPFLEQALESGGRQESLVLGTGRRAPLAMAALANGALAHALDYEDAHDPSRTHPNAAAVAAAVAIATARGGISGREFLLAVALGADVACRVSMAQGNVDELPRAFYPPAIAGTFGATATASRLLGLDATQVLSAFSIALCQNSCSAEILSDAYSDLRAVRDGFCAQAGVQAAQLAARGVRGFSAPFEGERGLYAMVSDGRHVPGMLTRELGQRFEGEFVGFKAWPACRDNHPYIQAVLEGQARDNVDPASIESIMAEVPNRSLIVTEPMAEKRRPRAAIDAKFSLYFTVAATVRHRAVNFGTYAPAALRDAATLSLADRVEYTVTNGPPRLLLKLKDGRSLQWQPGTLYGSPENPLPDKVLLEKFVDCGSVAQRPRPARTLRVLAQRLLDIESERDMRKLLLSL